MKPFSLLIKPASADCNLRCEYCFYINHIEKANFFYTRIKYIMMCKYKSS